MSRPSLVLNECIIADAFIEEPSTDKAAFRHRLLGYAASWGIVIDGLKPANSAD